MIGILHEVLEEEKRNEADRSSIIVLVLAAAVFLLRCGARMKSQYPLAYRLNTGKADWAIKCGGKIIMVIEAKAENLDEGVAQNKLQMLAAHQENTDGVSEAGIMYGVVSTASKWLVLRTEFAEDGGHKITKSNVGPISLPLEETEIDVEELHKQFKWLMENMMCPLYKQAGVAQLQQDSTGQLTQKQSQPTLDEQATVRKLKQNTTRQKRRRINE
jgi:predicted type IV restriction endonuclease